MTQEKENSLTKIHRESLLEFDKVQSAIRDERQQCLNDRRFCSIAGAQWEGSWGDQFANKPKLEVNKIHLSVIKIINEYRNNRITVDFISKDGSKNDDLADACDGLYRADEENSMAEEAYDNAFEEGVMGGFAAWRYRAEYEDDEDEENERQRICIEPIFDADTSVFFDLQAKRQDKADAKKCWVLTSMTPDAYMEEWDDDVASLNKDFTGIEFDWYTPDVVYFAEYYVVEETTKNIHVWADLSGKESRYSDEDLEEDGLAERLTATGSKEVRIRKVKDKRVHKYIMSGNKILEDCGYIAGKNIPIVPFYGKRWFVDNVERCMGHVRLAKDAQRLGNTLRSRLAEISAMSTIEKPIFTAEQMSGHSIMWEEDNVKNYPYLLINKIEDANGQEIAAGPVGYTKPPAIPPALAALIQITEEDINDVLGNNQNPDEMMPQMSGIAVELIQNRLDMQTFIYMSNFAKAIKRGGEIWLSMAKDILVEDGRKMKSVGVQGEIEQIELMRPMLDENGGKYYENDLSKAKFDVSVSVGPSSTSRRASTVRTLSSMMQMSDDPETKQVLGSMAMMNMEGEGIDNARKYFRKRLVNMGVEEPTEDEKQEMMQAKANQQPSPQDQFFMASAAKEQTEAAKNQVETIREQAEADKVRAQTQEILSKLDLEKLKTLVDVVERLGPRVEPQSIPGSGVIENG